jgi:MFS family permease
MGRTSVSMRTGERMAPTVSAVALRDAAVKDLSEEIPTKDALMVALAAGLGYGFDAYAVNIYGLVLPTITASLAIGSRTAGVIGSIFLIGYTLGTIGFGIAADRYGRRDTLGVSILLYGLTTSLGGLTTNVVWFTFMRFLTGIGGAGELAVGAPYTCEMFKTRHRALGTGGIMFSLYSLGYILAGLAALYIVPRWGWQMAFGIAIVPAMAVFVFRRFIQESVRYVIDKAENKFDAAKAVLAAEHQDMTARERAEAVSSIDRTRGDGQRGLDLPAAPPPRGGRAYNGGTVLLGLGALTVLIVGLLAHIPAGVAAAMVAGGALALLFTLALYSMGGTNQRFWHIPGVRKRIGIGWLLYSANAMGYWGITVFLTTFMVQKFGVSPQTAIGYAIMFYVAQFFFSYLGTGLSDRVGRRPAGVLGALIMMSSTVLAATASELGVFLVFGAIQIAMLGWLWGVSDTYLSEMFPTSIRGSCFGIGVGGGRIMSISAPFLTGAGIAAFGPTTPFLASAGLWVLTIVGYLLGPETAGKPLEQIEAEFVAESAQRA